MECTGEYTLYWSDNDAIKNRFTKTLSRVLTDDTTVPVYDADVGSDGPDGSATFVASAGCSLSWQHTAAVDDEQWQTWLCYDALMRGEDCEI